MIPSNKWFPTNLPAQAAFYANFNTQFQIVAASLGLASETGTVQNDNDVMQFLVDVFVQMDAFKEAMRQYRIIITQGNIGEPTPDLPPMPNFVLPKIIPTGMFERLNDLRERILVAPNYTDEIGALLGILPQTPGSISPADVKIKIKAFAAATTYIFTLVTAERGEAMMWDVYVLRKGAAGWEKIGTYSGKSADIQVTPTTPGEAEQMQVRAQGRKNNQNYGQPSDPVYVTVNP